MNMPRSHDTIHKIMAHNIGIDQQTRTQSQEKRFMKLQNIIEILFKICELKNRIAIIFCIEIKATIFKALHILLC